jgi:hypothetical protein
MSNIDTQAYTMCANCDHFIEKNDADDIRDYPDIAVFIHLDDGKEHDHDAKPSIVTLTIAQWRAIMPNLFTEYRDGHVGPNSAFYSR